MKNDRIPILQHISRSVRDGVAVDVYALVRELQDAFPSTSEEELERAISEEVAKACGSAIWDRRPR
ncbi:hypothetical protein [Aestuariivirga sp.]|uniref:hypothetical protein n=1 Tax=Aestuariivirga sp. TaxID=2650926 RepID=UPI00391A24A4